MIEFISTEIGHVANSGWTINGGTTGGPTSPIDTTQANLFVACLTYDSNSGPITISDTFGNTWIPLTERISLAGGPANVKARFYYVLNPSAGFPHIFTYSGTNSFMQAFLFFFRGVASFDVENGAGSFPANTIQPGSISPAEDNELVITVASFFEQNNTGFTGVTNGFTFAGSTGVTGQRFPIGVGYKIQTNRNNENPVWSYITNAAGVAAIASFKSALNPPFSFGVDAKSV